MSGYYKRYENIGNLSVCIGKDNSILSVENLGDDKVVLNDQDENIIEIKPGQTLSFGPNVKLYQEDLKVLQAKRTNYEEDDEPEDGDRGGWDCHD
jgi:hypothetical protein